MKIDFYILEAASRQQSMIFACSIIERIYAEEQTIFIYTSAQEEARYLDTLLWTYRDNSFLPHDLFDAAVHQPVPIQIGFSDKIPANSHETALFNLTSQIPHFYQQFFQVIEIVFNEPNVQQSARERYKKYRDQGHELNTFKIKNI